MMDPRASARRRAPAQAIVLAALGMAAMVGGVALVIDLGVFFVIERQMQAAADAAALAAVWFAPVCDGNPASMPSQVAAGCQTTGPAPDPADVCITDTSHSLHNDVVACTVALQFARANLGPVEGLCSGPVSTQGHAHINPYIGDASINPVAGVYVVAIDCDARHWFGQILPDLPLTMHVATNGAAAIGWRGASGDLARQGDTTPQTSLIARLIHS